MVSVLGEKSVHNLDNGGLLLGLCFETDAHATLRVSTHGRNKNVAEPNWPRINHSRGKQARWVKSPHLHSGCVRDPDK